MANDVPLNKDGKIQATYSELENAEVLRTLFTILDFIDDAMLLVNTSWKVKLANSSACKLFRLDKQMIIDTTVWELLPEKVKTILFTEYNKNQLEGKNETIQFTEYVSSVNSWILFKFLFTEQYIVLTLKKDEGYPAVQVMEQYYRILFDDNPDAVCTVDLNGRFLSVNTSFCQLFDFEVTEVIGKSFLSFVPENQHPLAREVLASAINGNAKTVQLNLSKEIGRPFSILVMAIPIIVDSKILGAYGIIKDITTEQENIENISYLNKMNQLILESVEDGILGIDCNLNVFMWNDAVERMTGYKKEDFTENQLKELLKNFDMTDVVLLKKGFLKNSQLTKDTIIRRSGATFYRKDGTPFLCEYTITPIVSEGGVVGSVLTFRDITEKKKSEEMLMKSEKLSAVGQLAAGIAHEIRNPLTSLKGFLQLIEINKGGKKEYYDIMRTEFGRIEQILNELLILSKPQTKEKVVVELHSLLNNTILLLNTQAIIKNIEIISHYPDETIRVRCIEHQIKQVFINIIKNAIEAMDEGGKITVSLEQDDVWAIVRISDEGCGIPEKELKRLGNPFYTTKENGTGLGLMVTYQIIEEHGGKIEIESEIDVGTTFSIYLPL